MSESKKIKQLIRAEEERQRKTLSLIASENLASKAVREALGSVLTNKYAEGKSRQRYYFGNQVVDEIEDRVKMLALKVFGLKDSSWGVNVQPYSGSIANLAVYLGLLKPGDKVLAMSLEHGGHLTHGHKVSFTGKFFNFKHYGVQKDGYFDYKEIKEIAKKFKPRLIVCGASAYPRKIDFKKFKNIAVSVNALFMADIAHIAGLVAAGAHPSPFPYADVVTATTHKTLRGPRGAVVFSKKKYADVIDKAIFPGLQGGPQLHTIAAMGVAFEEVLKPGFKKYSRQVVKNARALAQELKKRGFKLVSNGTDNHLILVDVIGLGLGGKTAGELLQKVGIVVNKNMLPYDSRSPFDPSGIRLGTPLVTTRGMKEKEMARIAELIEKTLNKKASLAVIKKEVENLALKFASIL